MSNAHILKNIFAAICSFSFFVSGYAGAAELFKKGPSVFNYNFAEVKYVDADGADGFSLTGSGDIQQNIALRVDFTTLSAGGVNFDTLRLGANYYIQSQAYPQADWVFGGGFDRHESESGIFVSGGGRYALSDAMEINGSVELNTTFDTDIILKLAALYEVSPGFSASLGGDFGDGSAISLGVRFYWR